MTDEFGLSAKQSREIEVHPAEYLREKVDIVRSKPRKNLAGAFMQALADDWKALRSTEQVKREKRAALVAMKSALRHGRN